MTPHDREKMRQVMVNSLTRQYGKPMQPFIERLYDVALTLASLEKVKDQNIEERIRTEIVFGLKDPVYCDAHKTHLTLVVPRHGWEALEKKSSIFASSSGHELDAVIIQAVEGKKTMARETLLDNMRILVSVRISPDDMHDITKHPYRDEGNFPLWPVTRGATSPLTTFETLRVVPSYS